MTTVQPEARAGPTWYNFEEENVNRNMILPRYQCMERSNKKPKNDAPLGTD